jgi:hypothetical protein
MEEFPDLFLQLGCGKSLGCPGARTTYRLPYFHANMEVDTIPRFITDAIENWVGGADERCGLRVAATGGGVRFEVRTKELSRYRSRSESTRAPSTKTLNLAPFAPARLIICFTQKNGVRRMGRTYKRRFSY